MPVQKQETATRPICHVYPVPVEKFRITAGDVSLNDSLSLGSGHEVSSIGLAASELQHQLPFFGDGF